MLIFLYVLILLAFFDMFAQLPIMSTYALSLGASMSMIGFIVGAYSVSNLFSNVFSGSLVDNRGPKTTITVGFILTGLILLSYSFVTTPIQLFIVRLLHGIFAGLLTPAAFTYVSLLNKKKRTGKSMAFAGAAVGIAAIMGPAFGGIISSKFGAGVVFQIVGSLLLIAGIVSLFVLKPIKKETAENVQQGKSQGYLSLFKNYYLVVAFAGAFSLMFSQGILAYMLPLKVDELQYNDSISGALLSIFGLVAILFFLLPTNKLYDKFKNHYLMSLGMLTISLGLVFLSLTSTLSIMYVAMVIYGIGFALLFPSISSLISKNTGSYDRGKAYGLFYGFFSFGTVAGSYTTGALSMSSTEAFLTAAVVLTVTAVIVLSVSKRFATEKSLENDKLSV